MRNRSSKIFRGCIATALVLVIGVGIVYVLAATIKPVRTALLNVANDTVFERFLPHDDDHNHETEHAHEKEDHDHADHDHEAKDADDHAEQPTSSHEAAEISFSPTAARNMGIDDTAIATVEVIDFYKSLSIPAVVVELPGFSTITVPSPASGIVTKIYHEAGVAVEPGEPLFDILLNQQELVNAQTTFLTLLKKREINTAELERLAGLDPQIVPKQRRELEYEKIQIDAEIDIQKSILLLQGLSAEDIANSLEKQGQIVRTMTVFAPSIEKEDNIASAAHTDEEVHIFTVDELHVTAGKNVAVGDSLCRLSDYCKLAIQGKTFAVNENMLTQALASKSRVTAAFEGGVFGGGLREITGDLFLRSIDNKIETNGTISCYVDLKNRFTNDEAESETGELHGKRRYIQWHFKPGQRCELSIEYEPLPNCIVLPIDAVAKDLQEMCVFEWAGREGDAQIWRKKPVHLIYRTKDVVILANDGSILPGAKVATKGASFILAALEAANQKNAGGGGVQHGDHVH